MEKPIRISSGEALAWNEEVERRRKLYHEHRCAVAAMMLADGEKMAQRLKELEEERPYAEEIRRTDERFDREIIRLSGFEW